MTTPTGKIVCGCAQCSGVLDDDDLEEDEECDDEEDFEEDDEWDDWEEEDDFEDEEANLTDHFLRNLHTQSTISAYAATGDLARGNRKIWFF